MKIKLVILLLFMNSIALFGESANDNFFDIYFNFPKGSKLISLDYQLVNTESNKSKCACTFLIDRLPEVKSQDYLDLIKSEKVLNLSFQEGTNLIYFSTGSDIYYAYLYFGDSNDKEKMNLSISIYKNPGLKEDVVKQYSYKKAKDLIGKLEAESSAIDKEIEKIKKQGVNLIGEMKNENIKLEKILKDKNSDLLNKLIVQTKLLIDCI